MRRDTWFRHRGSGPELLGENTTESAGERERELHFVQLRARRCTPRRRVHPLVHKRRWDDLGRRSREGCQPIFAVVA